MAKTEKQNPDETSGLATVMVRNEYYRDGFRSMLRLCTLLGIIIVGLLAAMFYVIDVHQPENRYFATTEDGRLIEMTPLSQPNLSTPALLSWVAQAATEVNTFGFSDYRRRLQEASKNFTREGWESFTTALTRAGIIESVEVNRQSVTAVPQGAPVILSEGVVRGRYQWQVELPIIITYEAGSRKRSDSLLVTAVVVRVSPLENPNGVGINQWFARAR